MKVYHIDNDGPLGWDSYDGHIVIADNEAQVRELAIARAASEGKDVWKIAPIEYLGEYVGSKREPCIILSSFNAG